MENAVLKNLQERRSIRKYLPKQVDEEQLQAILQAGMFAPTGRGLQSPVMIVVQDKEVREKLRKMNASVMGNPDMDPFYGAPTIIVVLADKTVSTCVEDGSLVMGNLMNAAHAVGVDSCYIFRAKEVFATEEGKEMLRSWGVPDHYEGVGNCILGYRDEGGVKPVSPRKENYIIKV